MFEAFPTDINALEFVKDRIIILTFVYGVFRSMFPNSKMLKAIGDGILAIKNIRKNRKKEIDNEKGI